MHEQLQLQNPSATVTAVQHAAEPPEFVTPLPEAEPDAGPRQNEDSEEGEWEDEDEVWKTAWPPFGPRF